MVFLWDGLLFLWDHIYLQVFSRLLAGKLDTFGISSQLQLQTINSNKHPINIQGVQDKGNQKNKYYLLKRVRNIININTYSKYKSEYE